MHKYERLEKLYYRKKYLKFFFIFFIIIILLILIYSYKENFFKNKKIKKSETNFIKKEKNFTKNIVEKNQTKKIIYKINKIKDTNKTENNIIKKNKTEKNISKKKEVLSFVVPKVNFIENNVTKKLEKPEIKTEKKEKNIKSMPKPLIIEEKININDLIKSYNQNPNYDIAIQISNFYLNKNMLDLAKLWALKANNLNPSKYESWKIFAIILLKKNQKQKAKEVLKTYLNDYGENEEIEKLLRSIDE